MLEVMMVNDGAHQGSIMLDSGKLRRFTNIEPKVISINAAFRPERTRVERFIEDNYARSFGARIARHYPTLISAQDRHGAILAAAGFRFAANSDLYLEQYLDGPIENVCAAQGRPARRDQIAEIGNLSSAGRGASIFLFLALADHLDQRGVTIAAATATKRLRLMFRTVAFDAITLGEADTSKLTDRGADWGAYYDCDPIVLAGDVSTGRRNLARLHAEQPSAEKMAARIHNDCGKDI